MSSEDVKPYVLLGKHIRLDEDVLKTSWRLLSKTKTKDVFKTSSRRLHQDECLLGNIFKPKIFKFIRPTASSIFGSHNLIGLKLLSRLRLGLSHLHEHKFKHSFQDILNPFCNCGKEAETTFHFLLSCSNYSDKRLTPLSKIRNVNPNILENTNSQIRFFLYGFL